MQRFPPISVTELAPVYFCTTLMECQFTYEFADPLAILQADARLASKPGEEDASERAPLGGIKIMQLSIDPPDVIKIIETDYSKGKGFGDITVSVRNEAAARKIKKYRATGD